MKLLPPRGLIGISLILSISLFTSNQTLSQKTPIEIFSGHSAMNIQMLFNQKLPKSEVIGIFSILNLNLPYDKADAPFRYYTAQANITFATSKTILLYTGVFSNKFDYGPSLGILARIKFKNGFILLNNRHSYGENYVTALLTLAEYEPPINENLSLYFRLQVLSETDLKVAKRNFQMLRIGLSKYGYQVGLAITFDQFGSQPVRRENYGTFFRILI